jgi:hypothetical protein
MKLTVLASYLVLFTTLVSCFGSGSTQAEKQPGPAQITIKTKIKKICHNGISESPCEFIDMPRICFSGKTNAEKVQNDLLTEFSGACVPGGRITGRRFEQEQTVMVPKKVQSGHWTVFAGALTCSKKVDADENMVFTFFEDHNGAVYCQ